MLDDAGAYTLVNDLASKVAIQYGMDDEHAKPDSAGVSGWTKPPGVSFGWLVISLRKWTRPSTTTCFDVWMTDALNRRSASVRNGR